MPGALFISIPLFLFIIVFIGVYFKEAKGG